MKYTTVRVSEDFLAKLHDKINSKNRSLLEVLEYMYSVTYNERED